MRESELELLPDSMARRRNDVPDGDTSGTVQHGDVVISALQVAVLNEHIARQRSLQAVGVGAVARRVGAHAGDVHVVAVQHLEVDHGGVPARTRRTVQK